jgi:hypothetical protein
MAKEGLTAFTVSVTPAGSHQIEVNGKDISDSVSGFTIQSRVGQPPTLTLTELGASGSIAAEGIVRVLDDRASSKEAILRFLDSISSSRLEKEVLERGDMSESIMIGVLRVLKDWAHDS